ncbi:HD domain-containing protein [Nitrosomonas aestuarii]|uniref:HD domain-containing protein n=1 Tax=Nitrosomonas aestuarii TaxID=52441 RepID=A0A1I4B5L3_9PROT|nr:HD domain-containing phosphohydrolase [Nitrosomonas aestuarii]SFK63650.1 HD domain-containing protein [Nitrosomonas aestuarii]
MKNNCNIKSQEICLVKNHENPALICNSILVEIDSIQKFISSIIEERYPDLNEHQTRISKNAALFAQHIGLSQQDNECLIIGASVHDIGKMSISDYILNKPAPLSRSEFSLVKQHCEYGYNLLTPLKLCSSITEIVLYHHENYDGSGYPEGLSNEDIPLLARMVRILDSYDALTMDRPYHKGVSSKNALKIMKQDMNCYDPYLLDSFSKVIEKHKIIQ